MFITVGVRRHFALFGLLLSLFWVAFRLVLGYDMPFLTVPLRFFLVCFTSFLVCFTLFPDFFTFFLICFALFLICFTCSQFFGFK